MVGPFYFSGSALSFIGRHGIGRQRTSAHILHHRHQDIISVVVGTNDQICDHKLYVMEV